MVRGSEMNLSFPFPVVLASASPRRRELLSQIVDSFEVVVADVNEEALVDADPVATARKTARAKGEAVARLRSDALIIAGDTVVAVDDEQLAKPVDEADAFRMLRLLSGRTHRVITGVCVVHPSSGITVFEVQTQVTFKELTAAEIREYIATGEPIDKAGAYGAQGEAAEHLESVEGSLTNVIGLPVDELREHLGNLITLGV